MATVRVSSCVPEEGIVSVVRGRIGCEPGTAPAPFSTLGLDLGDVGKVFLYQIPSTPIDPVLASSTVACGSSSFGFEGDDNSNATVTDVGGAVNT